MSEIKLSDAQRAYVEGTIDAVQRDPVMTAMTVKEHKAKLKEHVKTAEIIAAVNAENARVARLVANTKAVNEATGRLALFCATSRPALMLNAGLQRAFKHDALVAAGVFPAKLTGRQMDTV